MARSIRHLAAAVVVAAATVVPAGPALAHAEISPGALEAGEAATLTITSIVEREALVNADMVVIVPRQWEVTGCGGPATWTCEIDRESRAPDVVVDWTPLVATPVDITFTLDVVAPSDEADLGTYLFRAVQVHADGWAEPWVYDAEPYPAPRVVVAGVADLVNGEGSAFDPPCFGPTEQPADYGSHDGSAVEDDCQMPEAAAPADESPSPEVDGWSPASSLVAATTATAAGGLPATGGGAAASALALGAAAVLRRRR